MQDVYAQLESAGLVVDGALEYGRLIRCKTDDDKGTKKSGWYVLHPFTLDSGEQVIAGCYGNWKRFGDETLKVELELPEMTEEKRRQFAEEQKRLRTQAEQERLEREKSAAVRAKEIWEKLPDSGVSQYLDAKKVRGFGVRFSRGSVVVPVRKFDVGLVGLQFIDATGDKKFLTGTPKRGAWHLIGRTGAGEDKPLAIAEGYATAATIRMATGWACFVAFDAGNLLPVAQAVRAQFPDRKIIICADNDLATEGNPGVTKGRSAAEAVGGALWVPEWPEGANAID